MYERLVANASPLILLSGVGGLEWIVGLSRTPVLIPRAVATEVEASAGGNEVIGTLGIVLAAKRRGTIAAARPVIERLVDRGMFLSSDLIAASLREVGE